MTCRRCGKPLTSEEAKYYADRCEGCEVDWFERIEAWRLGGADAELDAVFSAPKPTLQ